MRANVLALIAFVATLLISSCQSDKTNSEHSDAPDEASQDPAESLSTIDLESIGLVDPHLHKEGSKEAWQGEIFNEEALAQLNELGSIFNDSEPLTYENLDGVIAKDAHTSPIVPGNSKTIFDEAPFSVRRPALRGITSMPLPKALNEFIAPFDPDTKLRSKFKIFSVHLDDDQPWCEVFVQITGKARGSDHNLTRRDNWRCNWEGPNPEMPPLLASVISTEYEQTESPRLFVDSSEAVFKNTPSYGAQFLKGTEHWAGRLETRYGIGISGWHGIALGDANGDGLDDLYVCEPGGLTNRLYLANSDGTVRDASAESGANFHLQTQSALFVDLDNDGDQDLVLATTLGVIFMANDGKGAFTVKERKLVPEAAPVALAAADLDLDGDLDIYTACYSLRRSSTDDSESDAAQLGRPIPYHDANNGGRNILYRNDRNWRFTDATKELGLDQNNRRYSFAPSLGRLRR